ncbi:unnamed protein product [Urochloa humidicola]
MCNIHLQHAANPTEENCTGGWRRKKKRMASRELVVGGSLKGARRRGDRAVGGPRPRGKLASPEELRHGVPLGKALCSSHGDGALGGSHGDGALGGSHGGSHGETSLAPGGAHDHGDASSRALVAKLLQQDTTWGEGEGHAHLELGARQVEGGAWWSRFVSEQ